MSCLDSDKVREQLKNKLGCIEETGKDHYWYVLYDEKGTILSRTKVSLGPKHALGPTLIGLMTRQIRLLKKSNFIEMVSCSLSKEQCLEIIKSQRA
jgi:hypothetical protein